MSAYLVVIRKGPITDEAAMAEYQKRTREMTGDYGLVPRVVYGATESLEGAAPDGVIMVEFPSMEKAREWYHSDEYQAAVKYRLAAADYDAFIVEGFSPQ